MSLKQRIQGINGWLQMIEAETLERLARGQVVLEIGSYFGRSTVAMAPMAKKVICIDYFRVGEGEYTWDDTGRLIPFLEKPNTRDIFERNVKPWRHKIEVHEMNSLDAVKLDWEPVGLLFIDGGHDTTTVLSDCGFLRWVVEGGFVAFHDFTGWGSVARAVRQIMTDNPEWIKIEGDYGTMAVFQRIQSENDEDEN